MVTPFTAQVEQQAEQRVSDEHQAQLASLKQEYEQRIAELEQTMKAGMAVQIKNQLLKLADYGVTPSNDAEDAGAQTAGLENHDVESTESG